METAVKKTLAIGASSLLALTAIAGAAVADAAQTPTQTATPEGARAATTLTSSTGIVTLDVVEGSFGYTQSAAATNEELRNNVGASQFLCGANPAGGAPSVAAEEWQISVGGAVSRPYTATLEELSATKEVQQVLLGCSCAGNPADGRASANALVSGISALTLIDIAGADADANTAVFTSADGYEVALPLSYLRNRYCPVVFDVNGAPLAESVGGVNQLWLGSTAASYFARDVVAVTLECRETPPASPLSDEARAAYENLPNVGVLLGGEVA